MVEGFDVEDTGALRRMSVAEYVQEGWAARYSLILLGRPGCGKTPLAKAIARVVALAWSSTDRPANVVVCSDIESLRQASVADAVHEGSSVLFDERTPIPRVGRVQCTIDTLKNLCTTHTSTDYRGRYNNYTIAPGGRFFTANCPWRQPQDWRKLLPSCEYTELTALEPLELCKHNPHAGAIFKRAFFVWLDSSVVPSDLKRRVADSARDEFAKRIRMVLD